MHLAENSINSFLRNEHVSFTELYGLMGGAQRHTAVSVCVCVSVAESSYNNRNWTLVIIIHV